MSCVYGCMCVCLCECVCVCVGGWGCGCVCVCVCVTIEAADTLVFLANEEAADRGTVER